MTSSTLLRLTSSSGTVHSCIIDVIHVLLLLSVHCELGQQDSEVVIGVSACLTLLRRPALFPEIFGDLADEIQ